MPDANPEPSAWRLYPPAGQQNPIGPEPTTWPVSPSLVGEPGRIGPERAAWDVVPAAGVAKAAASPGLVPPGYSSDDPLVLAPGMSTVTKEGTWTVPPFLTLKPGMGSIRLDCQLARPAAPVIRIEVAGGMGSILIVVPPGWAANLDGLANFWGSRHVRVLGEPVPGLPLLVVVGELVLGSLGLRYPKGRDRRRARRHAKLVARQSR